MEKLYTQQEFNDTFLEPINYYQDVLNYGKTIVTKKVKSLEELKLDENKPYADLVDAINDGEKGKLAYLIVISSLLNCIPSKVTEYFEAGATGYLIPDSIRLWTAEDEKEGVSHRHMMGLFVNQILDRWLPLACQVVKTIGYDLTMDELKEIKDKSAKEQAIIIFEKLCENYEDNLFGAYSYSAVIYAIAELNRRCYELLYPVLEELYDGAGTKTYKDLLGGKSLISSQMEDKKDE